MAAVGFQTVVVLRLWTRTPPIISIRPLLFVRRQGDCPRNTVESLPPRLSFSRKSNRAAAPRVFADVSTERKRDGFPKKSIWWVLHGDVSVRSFSKKKKQNQRAEDLAARRKLPPSGNKREINNAKISIPLSPIRGLPYASPRTRELGVRRACRQALPDARFSRNIRRQTRLTCLLLNNSPLVFARKQN